MKEKLSSKYKNAKQIDFMHDLKSYKGMKTSVIIPYLIMLSPIITTWLLYFFVYILGSHNRFIGHMNTFPFTILVVSIPIFCYDLKDIVANALINKQKTSVWTRIKTNLIKYPELVFLGLMYLWIAVSTIVHPSSFSFYAKDGEMQEGGIFYICYLLVFVFAFKLNDEDIKSRVILAFLITSIFCAISTILDPTSKFLYSSSNNTGWTFQFVNSNHYGYYLTMALLASAMLFLLNKSTSLRVFSGVCYLLNCVVLFFNDTLGCMLSMLITLILIPIILSIKNKKFNWIYILPLGVFIIISVICDLFTPVPGSTYQGFFPQLAGLVKDMFSVVSAPLAEETKAAGTTRWGLWLKAFNIIAENPIFGDGYVLFKPHNEFLQYACNYGIFVTGFYLIALILVLVKIIRNLRQLSDQTLVTGFVCVGYLISSLFGCTMPHIIPTFIVFFAFTIRSASNKTMPCINDNGNQQDSLL